MSKPVETHKYDDIINLPHHVSDHHPPMDLEVRAAQFSPFAALTGHEEVIDETAKMVINMVNHEITTETIEDV